MVVCSDRRIPCEQSHLRSPRSVGKRKETPRICVPLIQRNGWVTPVSTCQTCFFYLCAWSIATHHQYFLKLQQHGNFQLSKFMWVFPTYVGYRNWFARIEKPIHFFSKIWNGNLKPWTSLRFKGNDSLVDVCLPEFVCFGFVVLRLLVTRDWLPNTFEFLTHAQHEMPKIRAVSFLFPTDLGRLKVTLLAG